MPTSKPIASVSLDLDNKWSYLKIHGDQGWESFPSYLDIVVPRVLEFLKARDLIISVFVVGQDAALEKNHAALASIAAAGHEIGNHSFHHESWMHVYSETQVEEEIHRAAEAIERVTGQRPRGFRGPGFSLSPTILQVLARQKYLYDASTFPTFLGPLARAYYFMTTKLTAEERRKRKALFGSFHDGFQSLRPYRWHLPAGELIEIPVTTMPGCKVPIHVSYILYLSVFSPMAALAYFRTALALCRLTGTQPSLLLHPLDFLGNDDVTDLSFFPAMGLPHGKKLMAVGAVLDMLAQQFSVLTLRQHAQQVVHDVALPVIAPRMLPIPD
jgi:peptidoglycan-N-acetylglucosamine deacetylase